MSAIEAIGRRIPNPGLAMMLASQQASVVASSSSSSRAAGPVSPLLPTTNAAEQRAGEYWQGWRLVNLAEMAAGRSGDVASPPPAQGEQAASLIRYAGRLQN